MSLFDVHELSNNIVVVLPMHDDARTAIRHIHTIDMRGHKITMVIPARIFDSSAYIPFLRLHTQSTVDEARNLFCYKTGDAVPGSQKYHVCTLITNQRASILPDPPKKCATSSLDHSHDAAFVDLMCTMPTKITGHFANALIDTASNHSMITRSFLMRHNIPYVSERSVTIGVSASQTPCLGHVSLPTRVGRQIISVKFTVVDALPSATVISHATNDALFALDVISAVGMHMNFKKPRIVITVPPPKTKRGRKGRTWYHVVHLDHGKVTTESSSLDDFILSKRELKSLTSKAARGKTPLYVAKIKPIIEPALTCCAGTKKSGYLAEQVAPAHVPQDISEVPQCIQNVIHEHTKPGGTLGPPPPNVSASGFEMDIDLLPGTRPRAARQFRLTPRENLELEKQLQHLISMGWVQPSISPWASSVLFAPKPGGKLRLCIDYRYLNENTIKNTYPLPRIDALLDKLQGHKFFSALDLASGYHQIKLSGDAGPKTAFRTPDGLYQWTVMPFGLSNAPSVFQQAMHVVLKGLIGKICLAYLDDIIVLARSEEEHARNLDIVLSRLAKHNFFCNTAKCQFALTEIKYLGHIVTSDTVRPDPYKVQVLQNWPSEDLRRSPNQIRSFLGLAGYFRRFVPKFPTLAAPLLQRIKTKEQLPWTTQCDKSFQDIKQALVNATTMRHPDLNRSFHIYTDASDYAYGAVLTQEHEGTLCPIAWIGRKMATSEENYYTLEKELGAIVFAYKQWRCYLENNHTVFIHSDHNPLQFLKTQKKLSGKHARWLEAMSRIDWKITYIPGDKNVVADAVSRATHLPQTEVVLHDGLTLAAEHPQRRTDRHEQHQPPYQPHALTSFLVRRSPPQGSQGDIPTPTLSQERSSGQEDVHRGSPAPSTSAALHGNINFNTFPPAERDLLLNVISLCNNHRNSIVSDQLVSRVMQIHDLARQEEFPPLPPQSSSDTPPALSLALQPLLAVANTASASPPPPPEPQSQVPTCPPGLPPRAGSSGTPPITISGRSEQPFEEINQHDLITSGMAIDQIENVSTHLESQHTNNLTLDIAVDEFWERLRTGYAHDPAFRTPPTSYRFDKHLQCYFMGHKLVIPDYDSLRKQLIMWHHVHPWHAHMGIHRTQSLIMESFHWPGISSDIKSFVSQCHSCQIMKSPGCSDAPLSPLPIPTACWRIISLDMITQLPRTTSGMDCIVVFVDQFSKMTRLIPSVSTLDGPGFAKLFFQQIYPHYGLPLGICSDRGVQWNNKFFRSICDHMGIKLNLTYSYHPRANGQVERLNRVIEEALRHFVSPAHDDWDTFLPHIEFSINSAYCESTGCTPFQLNRITPPLSPTALAFQLPQVHKSHPAILHRMYYHLAKQSLSEAKQSMWSSKPQHKPKQFQEGKHVLLSLTKLASHHPSLRKKFSARWVGPCKILELVGSRAARLQLPTTLQALGIHDVFHFSSLKPFTDAHFNEFPHEPTSTVPTDAEEVFEVESITDYRRTHTPPSDSLGGTPRKGPHYLVRWKGYSSQHDLWLPVSELNNCLDKVADYLFNRASPAQRAIMIDQFPRAERDQLAHLLQRAQGPNKGRSEPAIMSRPPRLSTRTRRQSSRLAKPVQAAAITSHAICSSCARCL